MYPKIKIPVDLWNKVAHQRTKRKAVSTFLVLKAVCDSGKFQGYVEASGESERNFRRRVDALLSLGLLSHSDSCYKLASWETVQELFDLPHNNKFYYVPYAERADNGYTLEDELFVLATRDAQIAQKKAIKATLANNATLRQDIKTATGTTHSEAVFYAQLDCWKKEGQGYDSNDRFVLMHPRQEGLIRFDTQCSTAHYNYLFEYHGRGSWAYRKKRMEALALIVVQHRRIELPKGTHTTLEARQCDFGHVEFIEGKLWLILPDKIEFFSPAERKWMQESKTSQAAA